MDWLVYAHPIFGAAVVGLVFSLGQFGLRARGPARRREDYLRWHVRLGPWVCAAALLAQASGVVAVLWGRTDLTVASSVHFRSGTVLVCLLLVLFFSRPFMHYPLVRQLHPWVGAFALLVAGAHIFFGLQLTR